MTVFKKHILSSFLVENTGGLNIYDVLLPPETLLRDRGRKNDSITVHVKSFANLWGGKLMNRCN